MRQLLIHITDLYKPPQDPDDFFDLATVMALPEFDPIGVILDCTNTFLADATVDAGTDASRNSLEPGFTPVSEIADLTGRNLPVAMGPTHPLSSPFDDARSAPEKEQEGIELLLDLLSDASETVIISVVGSARTLGAAYNRDPNLLHRKVRKILMNSGSSGSFIEWNVSLDPNAYIRIMGSGLPVEWYPCGGSDGAFETTEHNTYWAATNGSLLNGVPKPLQNWFSDGLGESWDTLIKDSRNMWSTASLVMAAGRCLAKMDGGWCFIPHDRALSAQAEIDRWSLEPVLVELSADAATRWSASSDPNASIKLFHRENPFHSAAMAEALNSLLRGFPISSDRFKSKDEEE